MLKQYRSLYKTYKDQPNDEIFAHFRWDEREVWESPFEKLANLAKKEEWNFRTTDFKREGKNYPILMSYLNYTFLRVQELNLISYSIDKSKACFNTGLQTRDEKDIYATFYKAPKTSSGNNLTDWTFYAFADSYSDKVKDFNELPNIATYISDASDLVFDTSYDIDINIAHIVDRNNERLPDSIRNNRTLAVSAIEGATKVLKQKIIRNYKIAIPHWFGNKIQLLLPLNLTSDIEADLALVADKDKDRKLYRIKTALSMDMAYVDARLICCPDREWLNP